ncbi:DUF305 domain-containing protein [Amycolatopsis acidicola]|uniref:DUF305 domain-containing protein n=1 Tax=Amycolatopsis acidicola TaxID=2596893 RepID=A0A5N0UMV2_9PSEU|nr:DUF305 domain-containing protein [Amycolatopsis acidicola]KAA9150350.1 DUF305 domain-containing protein [Amycolatopsis acidicola]
MTRKILARTVLAVLASFTLLTGCGTDTTQHNQADVTFAREMIPHHRQALDMAALVPGRTADAKISALAEDIRKAQDPEIQQMTGWLTAWGSTPATSGMDMSTMDLSQLEALHGGEFDRMWLRMMIEHHQGALAMAGTELAQGADPAAKALAQSIIDGQQAQIGEMNTLLAQG